MIKNTWILLFIAALFGACGENQSSGTDSSKELINDSTMVADDTDEVEVDAVQTNEERILDIKKWYKDIRSIEKKGSSTGCESKISITYDGFHSDDEYPFENEGKHCDFGNGYTVLFGEFLGYEWAEYATYYYKDDVLFFAFIESGAEACFEEHRLYYGSDGKVIQYIEKVNDCDGENPTITNDLTDSDGLNDMVNYVNEKRTRIEKILADEK